MRKLFARLFFLAPFSSLVLTAQTNDSIPLELQEVQVSATLRPSTSLSSTPLQVLTANQIQKQGIQSVTDAVRRFNGVILKDFGGIGGLKTVSIRGMGAEYTAISYDGMPISNSQSGQVDIGRFTLDNISMLSLSIGQEDNILRAAKVSASAGVLNFQTLKPEFTDKNQKLNSKITTGSFGLFEPMIIYAQRLSSKSSLSANANWQRADGQYPFSQANDHLLGDRKRRNSDTNILRTEVNMYNELSTNDNLDVKLYYFDSERGIPGAAIQYAPEDNDRLWDKNAFVQLTYNKKFDQRWQWHSIAKYDHNYQKYKREYFVEGKTADGYNKYRQNEIYWTNMAMVNINSEWSASLAQDLIFNNLKSTFAMFNDSRSEPERWNSFTALTLQYKTPQATLTINGLNTYVSENITNRDDKRIYRRFSPSLSASVQPTEATNWRLRASYKHIYRIPTFNEMYFVTTDRGLKPESSSQYNIGTTWVGSIADSPWRYINLSADFYYNDVNDKIVIVPVLPVPKVSNTAKVKMKGADIRATSNIRITDKIDIDLIAVYSYLRAYDDNAKSPTADNTYKGQLPYTPRHSGSGSLTVNNPWVNISYSVIASGVRYISAENIASTKMDSYTEHSIAAFKELRIRGYKLYGTASLLNLLNKNYHIIKNYPMPGRSFKVSVGCSF